MSSEEISMNIDPMPMAQMPAGKVRHTAALTRGPVDSADISLPIKFSCAQSLISDNAGRQQVTSARLKHANILSCDASGVRASHRPHNIQSLYDLVNQRRRVAGERCCGGTLLRESAVAGECSCGRMQLDPGKMRCGETGVLGEGTTGSGHLMRSIFPVKCRPTSVVNRIK